MKGQSITKMAMSALFAGMMLMGCQKAELVKPQQAVGVADITSDASAKKKGNDCGNDSGNNNGNGNGQGNGNGNGNSNGNGNGNGSGNGNNNGNGQGGSNNQGPAIVNLGASADYAILSQSGITNVYPSVVTGNVGSSPITGAAILLTCAEVNGAIYSVDAAGPLPCRITNASGLTTAVGDMQTAYNDAAGRTNPDFLNLGSGVIGGVTLSPGLYKWTSPLLISSSIVLSGGANDVWIFQVSGTFDISTSVNITLQGGAQAKNIFWQVAGAVTLGTYSHFEGNILGKTGINLLTGASVNGRLLAQTAAVLQISTVTKP